MTVSEMFERTWPGQRTGRLATLWSEGHSTRAIAKMLNVEFQHLPQVSASAVHSKLCRMGLQRKFREFPLPRIAL